MLEIEPVAGITGILQGDGEISCLGRLSMLTVSNIFAFLLTSPLSLVASLLSLLVRLLSRFNGYTVHHNTQPANQGGFLYPLLRQWLIHRVLSATVPLDV